MTGGEVGEVVPRIVIEIRPETPISSTWRLYMKEGPGRVDGRPPGDRMLRKGAHVYGGTMREAHQQAVQVARENGFIYEAPHGMGLVPPGRSIPGADR